MSTHYQETRRPYRRSTANTRRRRGGLARVLILCTLAGAAYVALASPVFRIRYNDARVPDTSKTVVSHSVPLQSNLLLFDPARLEETIARDPLVASVTITKVQPDTVRVETVLRQGVMRVRAGEQFLEVDRQGVAFRCAVGKELPLLSGVDTVERVGDVVASDAIATALVWLDAVGRYSLPRVEEVEYIGDGVCSLVLEDRREVRPGDTSEVDRKLAAAEAILAYWRSDLEYVDVAIPTQPVVGRVVALETPSGANGAPPPQDTGGTDHASDG